MNENTSRHGSAQILDERMTAATDKFEIVATERAADVITGREESWEGRVSSLMIPAVVLSPVKRGSYRLAVGSREMRQVAGNASCHRQVAEGNATVGRMPLTDFGRVRCSDDSLVAATSVLSQHITTSPGQQTAAQKPEYTSDDDIKKIVHCDM